MPEVPERFDGSAGAVQAAYLSRCAPGFRVRRVQWSEGTTAVIEGGQGPPLLLVHGGGGAAFQWGPILSFLAKRYHVLAVDRPGHGLADPFDYRGVDLFAHADRFLADFLNVEGLSSVAIAANSMGGLFSLAFALQSPERIEHIWLVGAPAGLKRRLPLTGRLTAMPVLRGIIRRMIKRPTREWTRAFWARALVAHPERLANDFLEVEVLMTRRNSSSIISLLDRFIDLRGVKPDLVLGPRWELVRVPTTFVMGECDQGGSAEEAEALVLRNHRLGVVRIPNAGHLPWVDSPESVAGALTVATSEGPALKT